MEMSMVCTAAWGHVDIHGASCHLWPCLDPWSNYSLGQCWCQWPVTTKDNQMSIVCAVAWSHVDVCDLCSQLRPCRCPVDITMVHPAAKDRVWICDSTAAWGHVVLVPCSCWRLWWCLRPGQCTGPCLCIATGYCAVAGDHVEVHVPCFCWE